MADEEAELFGDALLKLTFTRFPRALVLDPLNKDSCMNLHSAQE
jgi:hypothetical protein